MGIHLLTVALDAYLLGSVPFGLLFGRAFGICDVRNIGNGHAGALYTWRGAGWPAAALTLIADVEKGTRAVWFATRYGQTAYTLCVAIFVRHISQLPRTYADFWIDSGRVES